jgi:hypothetical protein
MQQFRAVRAGNELGVDTISNRPVLPRITHSFVLCCECNPHRVLKSMATWKPMVELTTVMTEEEEIELRSQLERLRQEHRDLDAAIEALQMVPGSDSVQVQRLKKRKLVLRDRIGFIEDILTPDIIA